MSEPLVLKLPLPPSINRVMKKLGNSSPNVVHWQKLCDGFLLTQRRARFEGPYILSVTWSAEQFGKFDCDNRLKCLGDYLQRVEIVDNDRNCWKITAEFGDVERDWCRVEIRERGES